MNDISPVDLLGNQLMSYFGDADDPEALASIRSDILSYSETRRAFREGLALALSSPRIDRVGLVRAANRRAESDQQARAWLEGLRDALTDQRSRVT